MSDRTSIYLLSLRTTSELANLNDQGLNKLANLSILINYGSTSLMCSDSVKTINETMKNLVALEHVINDNMVKCVNILFNASSMMEPIIDS